MASGNTKTEIRIDPENGQWLSRADFMAVTGVIERTLTNRIKSGYYTTRLTADGSREILLQRKPVPEKMPESPGNSAGIFSGRTGNGTESFPDQDRKQSQQDPESNSKAFDIVGQALHQVDMYAKELIKAGEERGYYRAITDTHTQTEKTLKNEIFERDALIKQLQAQQPDIEVLAKVKQLEAQLANAEQVNAELHAKLAEAESLKAENDKQRQELDALKSEKGMLTSQLESERKKSALDKLFGR